MFCWFEGRMRLKMKFEIEYSLYFRQHKAILCVLQRCELQVCCYRQHIRNHYHWTGNEY